MSPGGFMKGMKRMLGASSKLDKKPSGILDSTDDIYVTGSTPNSRRTRSSAVSPASAGHDQESFPLPGDGGSFNRSSNAGTPARRSRQTTPGGGEGFRPSSQHRRDTSPAQFRTPAPSMAPGGPSRGAATAPVGKGAGPSRNMNKNLDLEGLEIPDQAYEVGPPPMPGNTWHGRSGTPQDRARGSNSSNRQLLADLEQHTGPTVGPVYESSPVKQTHERLASQLHTPERHRRGSRHRDSRNSSSTGSEARQRQAWGGGSGSGSGGVSSGHGLQIEERADSAKDFKAMVGAASPAGEDVPMQRYFRRDVAEEVDPGERASFMNLQGVLESPGVEDQRTILETDSWHSSAHNSPRARGASGEPRYQDSWRHGANSFQPSSLRSRRNLFHEGPQQNGQAHTPLFTPPQARPRERHIADRSQLVNRKLMSMPLEDHAVDQKIEPVDPVTRPYSRQRTEHIMRSGDWERQAPLDRSRQGLLSGEYPRIGDVPLHRAPTPTGLTDAEVARARLTSSSSSRLIGRTDEYSDSPTPLDLRVPQGWAESRARGLEGEGLRTQPHPGRQEGGGALGEGYSPQDKLARLRRDAQILLQRGGETHGRASPGAGSWRDSLPPTPPAASLPEPSLPRIHSYQGSARHYPHAHVPEGQRSGTPGSTVAARQELERLKHPISSHPGVLPSQPSPHQAYAFGPGQERPLDPTLRLRSLRPGSEADADSVHTRHSTPLGYQATYTQPLDYGPPPAEGEGHGGRGGQASPLLSEMAAGVGDARHGVTPQRRPSSTSGISSRGVSKFESTRFEEGRAMSMRGATSGVGLQEPRTRSPLEGPPPRMATPTPSRLSETLISDDSRRWKVAQLQVQSPVYGVEHEEQVATPDLQEEAMRRLDYSTSGSNIPTQTSPQPEKEMEGLPALVSSKQQSSRVLGETASQMFSSTSYEDPQSEHENELAELRGVVAYLQSKLGGLEKELHGRREEEGDLRAEVAARQAEMAQSWARLAETERDKAELVTLVIELKGNLERTTQEHSAELERVSTALQAAEAEAAAQEELAELANGELEEYQRRMAAEVHNARQEALKAANIQIGDKGKLEEELARVTAKAGRAKQERDSLNNLLATAGHKQAQQDAHIGKLKGDLAEATSQLSELEARVESLERENEALHSQLEGHEEQAEELQALREEAASWEAQLAESEETLAKARALLAKREEQQRSADANAHYDKQSLLTNMDLSQAFATLGSETASPTAHGSAAAAAEEASELASLRSQLATANQEMQRLHQIEDLANQALTALEAQTQEAIRLRSHTASLEASLTEQARQAASPPSPNGHKQGNGVYPMR